MYDEGQDSQERAEEILFEAQAEEDEIHWFVEKVEEANR